MSTPNGPQHGPEELSFEAAMRALETIVEQLEEGRLSLEESLAKYEEGVGHVKHCFRLVELVERKIALLTGVDADGNPVTQPFADQDHEDLDRKAAARGQRRTAAAANKKPVRNVDESDRLF
jgi:exodeoxyribonuclease VII small subunit